MRFTVVDYTVLLDAALRELAPAPLSPGQAQTARLVAKFPRFCVSIPRIRLRFALTNLAAFYASYLICAMLWLII